MDVKVNRVYKDRLFRLIFSSKEELLALYNAVRGTQYKDCLLYTSKPAGNGPF